MFALITNLLPRNIWRVFRLASPAAEQSKQPPRCKAGGRGRPAEPRRQCERRGAAGDGAALGTPHPAPRDTHTSHPPTLAPGEPRRNGQGSGREGRRAGIRTTDRGEKFREQQVGRGLWDLGRGMR